MEENAIWPNNKMHCNQVIKNKCIHLINNNISGSKTKII